MAKVIFTADDSASMRQMISFTLRQAGYEVAECIDGSDAMNKMAKSASVDMLITDLNMPNKDGIQLITWVREQPQFRFIPVIMLTTESADSKKQAGKNAGATGWIVKPFQPDQLLAVVKKVLR